VTYGRRYASVTEAAAIHRPWAATNALVADPMGPLLLAVTVNSPARPRIGPATSAARAAAGPFCVRGWLAPVPDGLGGELGAGGEVELGEHVRKVGLHRPAGDVQALADLGVGQSLGDQVDYGPLAGGQARPAAPGAGVGDPAAAADPDLPQRGLGPGQVPSGIQPLVQGDRPVQELAGPGRLAPPRDRGGCVLAGQRELQRTRPARRR
jgi:hypothetical protein